jgi:phage terminase large subunit
VKVEVTKISKAPSVAVPKIEPRLEQSTVSVQEDLGTSPASTTNQITSNESTDDSLLQPEFGEEYVALDIADAAIFATMFSPLIMEGKENLYPWQVEELELASRSPATQQEPFKYALCACNGSGKDLYFIAVLALFFACCKTRFKVVITSASAKQLNDQSEKYIVSMANYINHWSMKCMGRAILKINQHHITCLLSASEIFLFVTDEEGKAEGYHPYPGGGMAIIVNEAKSVSPDIFRALRRCTGYTHFLLVSSPGEPKGDFYDAFQYWPHKRRITVFDCPHHSRSEFEDDKRRLGEHDPYFRSKWLAAFTSVGGRTVLNLLALERLRRAIFNKQVQEILQHKPIRVGIDLALSGFGDETVISAWKGNRQIAQFTHKIKDATKLADQIEQDLLSLKLQKSHPFIFADDGGVGRGIIHILWRKGWSGIRPILNQARARNTKHYRNRGAELWHKFARLVEGGCIIPLDDQLLYAQLSSRKFKESTASMDKVTLQSKASMLAEGLPSPDRADAAVLAFTDADVDEFLNAFEIQEPSKAPAGKVQSREEIEAFLRQGEFLTERSSKIMGSLSVLMKRQSRRLTF